MNTARLGLLLALSCSSVAALAAPPNVLIYQSKVVGKDKDDPNIDITQSIAQEYDTNGRLVPIVYSVTDPAFHAAIVAGKLKNAPDYPQVKQVFEVAHQLRAEYVIVVEAAKAGKSVRAKLRLFHDGRQVWHDEDNLTVKLDEVIDPISTAKSLSHTLTLRMDAIPLKSLPEHLKIQSPAIQPGQAPEVTQPPVKVSSETSDADLKSDIAALVKANKSSEAILKMRDAVDAAPFDIDRRLALVELLQTTNPVAAAEEARRAAIVMPEKIELRVTSARAWIRAGQPQEAQKDLNEAVARDPNGAPTRLLLGELSLQQLEPTKALGHLDEVIKQQDSGQARFLRALCRALLGGTDGMQADLAQADKLEPSRSPELVAQRYQLAAEITDRALSQDSVDLKTLILKVVVKPKDQALHDQLEQMQRLLQSRTVLLTTLAVPPKEKLAQDQRLLAYKLITQSVLDVQTYSNSGDEDILAEARINLGEALKQLTAAKTPPTG